MKQVIVLIAMVILGIALFNMVTSMQAPAKDLTDSAKAGIVDLIETEGD